ncbi:hypothetical protein MUK42_18922 [Musa troglodytarum]|uniref:Stomagen C-terminal domain-containing protein n=1 Tax=Musa troglodytarum TaxID=320322 RepID=A0A9E7G1U4_9LILI|nr:hypothetical protein MUK42_18922 [Musa troglodytarum]
MGSLVNGEAHTKRWWGTSRCAFAEGAAARRHEIFRKATVSPYHRASLYVFSASSRALHLSFPIAPPAAWSSSSSSSSSSMASRNPTCSTFLLFFFVSATLVCALRRPGLGGQVARSNVLPPKQEGDRRAMIGSRAPICTYNECRGCRFKCSAEQVPVDAGDPMNSAYRYRCVCHR